MLRYLFIISLTILLFSCKKDISNDGSWQNLRFSNDTVIFDTTFQSIGTTTKTLKVYNRSKADIYTDISLEEMFSEISSDIFIDISIAIFTDI